MGWPLLRRALVGLLGASVLSACGAPTASSARSGPPPRASPYAGVTTCGAPVPPEPPDRALPTFEPAIEPMFGRGDAPAPPPAFGLAPAPDFGVVEIRLRRHFRFLNLCTNEFYARAPEEGSLKIDLRFAIDADGRVTGVEVHGAEAVLDRCLCDRLSAIDYRGIGAAAVLRYPLWLSP